MSAIRKKQNASLNYSLYSREPSKEWEKNVGAMQTTLTCYDLFSLTEKGAIQEALKIVAKRKLDIDECIIEFYRKIDEHNGETKVISLKEQLQLPKN